MFALNLLTLTLIMLVTGQTPVESLDSGLGWGLQCTCTLDESSWSFIQKLSSMVDIHCI